MRAFTSMSVEVPTHTFLALMKQLRQSGSAADPSPAVSAAIDLWLAEQQKLAGGSVAAGMRGYQWNTYSFLRARCCAPGAMASTTTRG